MGSSKELKKYSLPRGVAGDIFYFASFFSQG
jgi:hypothetical protein